jgi:hypothetical protein
MKFKGSLLTELFRTRGIATVTRYLLASMTLEKEYTQPVTIVVSKYSALNHGNLKPSRLQVFKCNIQHARCSHVDKFEVCRNFN